MEPTHLSSQLDYLDRKDQENQKQIAELEKRLQAQAYELQEQAHRMQGLETELAETKTRLGQIPPLDEQFVRFKNELLEMVEERYRHRQQNVQELSNFVANQVNSHTKTMDDLRREIEQTRRYDEQILLARTQVERLSKEVTEFQTKLDLLGRQLEERVQPITYLEEQRRSDARRLAELQLELPDIHKKIESNLSKIQVVEQQIPQFGKYELALEEIRDEVRRHRDHMDFQVAQRERQIRDWTKFAEAHEKRITEYEGLMEKYVEHYQVNKRALESLQDFQERIQREHHQAMELQRLAEERQRTRLEKWQADYEQRWKKQNVEWKPQVADLQRTVEGLQKQIDEVSKSSQGVYKQLSLLMQIVEDDVHMRVMAVNDWQQRFEELATSQE